MNEYEFFQKSFSDLHASEQTLHKVMCRVQSGKGVKGISKRFAVLVAVTVILFSMALVVHASGLLVDLVANLTPTKNAGQVIENAFGNIISTEKPRIEDAYGNPLEAPSMDRPALDPTESEKLIGAYISDVNDAVTIGQNTFTLENFLVDETGCGAIIWTVENPNGIAYGDAGYGMVYFNSWTIDNPMMYHYAADGSKRKSMDLSTALISKNETDTKLELVSYFGTVDKYEIGDSFVWMFSQNRKQDKQKIKITPVEHIPTLKFKEANGMELTIANQGLTIEAKSDVDFITDKIVIHFKDGTCYCVEDDEEKIYNLSGAYWRQTKKYRYDELVCLFNRIIDTDEVSFVEVTAGFLGFEIVGDYYEPVRYPQTFVFYPE